MKRLWQSLGLALSVVAAPVASVAGVGAYLHDPFVATDLQSVEQLVQVVQTDPRVRSLFARHFGIPASRVAPYFQENLEFTRLTEARTVTVYRVTRRGRIYRVRERLQKGTPIFALTRGEPVLKGIGANPLVRRLPAMRAVVRLTKGGRRGQRGQRGHKQGMKRPVPVLAHTGLPLSHRDTGRAFLLPHRLEAPGYGLYSYLLFGSPPSDDSRGRYLQAITAYLAIPTITSLEERRIPRVKLNITYLPIGARPPADPKPEWVLEHYDYACARALIDLIGGTHRDGPYIVCGFHPLLATRALSDHYLYQDLSSVPPEVILLWVKEFLADVEQERFWEGNAVDQFVLSLRTNIARVAHGWAPIESAVSTLINYFH